MVCSSNLATSPDDSPAFPIYFSHDLVNWSQRGHVFPAGGWPRWGFNDAWAPEIHRFGSKKYHVYFTMRSREP